jgi:dTDP-D-glucose 4,6-dehydratase
MSVRALAETVVELTGSKSPIKSIERPVHDHDSRLPGIVRAERELGWYPSTSLETGLTATIADIAERLDRYTAVAAQCRSRSNEADSVRVRGGSIGRGKFERNGGGLDERSS